ncbi:hypothetical protein WG66_001075 [Moniliophthora roreri]|uniref:Uncharacterized protein n=1 Tax=Moniliophthora roreri TaxID=221103 RepID=A0A0W0FJ91_MONRR|nr:hypothetical protein WG66_001075 [Moniliophthora roreri]
MSERQRQALLISAYREQKQQREDRMPWVVPPQFATVLEDTFRDVKCDFEDLDGLKWSPEHLKEASKTFTPPSRPTTAPQRELPRLSTAQPKGLFSPVTIGGKVVETQSLDGVLSISFSKGTPHTDNVFGDRTNGKDATPQSSPLLDGPVLPEATPTQPAALPLEKNSPFEPRSTTPSPSGRPRGRSLTRTHSRTRTRTGTLSRTVSYRHIDIDNPENNIPKHGDSSSMNSTNNNDEENDETEFMEEFSTLMSFGESLRRLGIVADKTKQNPRSPQDSSVGVAECSTPTPTQKSPPDSGDCRVLNLNAASGSAEDAKDKCLPTSVSELTLRSENREDQDQDQVALNSTLSNEEKPWRPLSFRERYGAALVPATQSPIASSESGLDALDSVGNLKTFSSEFFQEEDTDALYEQIFDAMERQVDEELGIKR